MRVELHLDPSACAQPQRGFVLNDRFHGTSRPDSGPATDPNRDHNQAQPWRAHLWAAEAATAAVTAQSPRVTTHPATGAATTARLTCPTKTPEPSTVVPSRHHQPRPSLTS